MRKTFAAGAATSGTGCPTRVNRVNRRAFQRTPKRINSSRPPLRRQTIDYLDQTIIDYRDHSHGTESSIGAFFQPLPKERTDTNYRSTHFATARSD